ncbi:acetyltransferase [Vibrio cholerae]|nr:acetyltransferase [Vibrio cholerae]KAA1205536.1 acetyltransferase [Vibrio cholerae]KAA1218642.1 acetyltransferase [Vibrio cholerae]TYW31974.1 acetyltransferase [Vibrio cholerae]
MLCLSLVVMRCQPLRRALCKMRESSFNVSSGSN